MSGDDDAPGASIGGPVPDRASRPAHLWAMAKAAYAGYQTTRYDDTGRLLPTLTARTAGASTPRSRSASARRLPA